MPSRAKILFAKNLAALRSKRNLTQAQLCGLLDVSRSQISHWVNPDSNVWIGDDNLDRIAIALDVPIARLFSEKDVGNLPEYIQTIKIYTFPVDDGLFYQQE